MPNAKIKVDIKNCDLNIFGQDAIEFLFDANKSNRFEPLRKVASGGELSRIMLGLKGILAQSDRISVLVYGRIIATGSGEEIRANAEVRSAYLGDDADGAGMP